MANKRSVVTTTIPLEPATGEIHLPDASEFVASPVLTADNGSKPGRVEGIDYDQWAVAIIDLNDDPDRVAAQRLRIGRKGYKKVEGNPIAGGFSRPEVWVKPRAQYERDRQALRARFEQRVRAGDMPESAVTVGQLHYTPTKSAKSA